MARGKNPTNNTGRNKTSRFAMLEHRVLESPAYRALSPNARSLLVELTMIYNGSNNGSLWLSVRDAAARLGVVDTKAASAAFDELQDMGFIAMTVEAHFHVKASDTSRARCWKLTWLAMSNKSGPSNEYQQREPKPQSRSRKRMEAGLRALKTYKKAVTQNRMPVEDSHTLTPNKGESEPLAVVDSPTAKSGNGAFTPKLIVEDSATHTSTMGMGRILATHWWRGDGQAPDCGLHCITDSKSRSTFLAKRHVALLNYREFRNAA